MTEVGGTVCTVTRPFRAGLTSWRSTWPNTPAAWRPGATSAGPHSPRTSTYTPASAVAASSSLLFCFSALAAICLVGRRLLSEAAALKLLLCFVGAKLLL